MVLKEFKIEENYNVSQSGTSMVIDNSPKPQFKYRDSPKRSKFVKPHDAIDV